MSDNLYSHIERAMPDERSSAVLTTDAGRICTWRELDEQSARLARLLLGLGLERGARVAVQVEKSPESLFLYLACLRAGLAYLPLNTAYQQAELEYFLGDAQPGVVVCRPGAAPQIAARAGTTSPGFTSTTSPRARATAGRSSVS